jgi:hypothetical protein
MPSIAERRPSTLASVVMMPVAVDLERAGRRDDAAVRAAHAPQGDDVARALVEVDRGPDEQVAVALALLGRVAVELGPYEVLGAGLGVDDHDGLSAACEAAGSSIAGAPVCRNASIVSRPGTFVMSLEPG